MNYFSKYVTKFHQGGAVDAAMQLAAAVVQHFDQLAQILPEEAQQTLMAKLQKTAPKSKEEAIAVVAQTIAETPELEQMLNAALQPQEQPQQYKNGGAISYIDRLRCGGKPDCGCRKAQDGAKVKKQRPTEKDTADNAVEGMDPEKSTPEYIAAHAAPMNKKKKTLVGKAVDVAKKLLSKNK